MGWTENENPCTCIEGHSLGKRDVYISDEVYRLVYEHGNVALKDAMDLAYLTGQRPGDMRPLTEHDIMDGYLVIKQSKTGAPLRFIIEVELKALLDRIEARKKLHKIWCANLLVNQYGKAMSKEVLRKAFDTARSSVAEEADRSGNTELAVQIRAFGSTTCAPRLLDVADEHGELVVSKQLGHTSVQTTKRHYLRRGAKAQATR